MTKTVSIGLALTVSLAAFIVASLFSPLPPVLPRDLALFFRLVAVVESLLFGVGVSFTVSVLTRFRTAVRKWTALDWATFVSIAWILISGYPHDCMHIRSHAATLRGLVPIEILFHGTLAIAALVVMWFFVRNLGKQK